MKNLFTILLSFIIIFVFSSNYALAYSYNKIGEKNPSSLNTMSIISPLHIGDRNEEVTAPYNEPRDSRFHQGVDYSTYNSNSGNYNRPVYPVASGTVHGYNNGTGNRYIILKHTYNNKTWYSVYMHLQSVSVTSGSVTTNTQIGVSGSSGTTAPHLHWELNTSNYSSLSSSRVSIDPTPYLINQYNVQDWTLDHSLINFVNYFDNTGTLQASIYGIRSKQRTLASETPKAYWRYNGETSWRVATGSYQGSYVYYFTIPKNTSKSYIEYIIYAKGKWWSSTTSDDTHYNTVYQDAAENPSNWGGQDTSIVAERYYY